MTDGTVRVAYACVCERCEACIKEEVREVTYAEIQKLYTSGVQFHLYHDRGNNALFRRILPDRCRAC